MNRLATVADHVLPFAMTALTLAAWATTYDGTRWFVVGLIGAGVAGLLASRLAWRGWGADIVVLALIPLYLVSAGPVASAPLDDALVRVVLTGTIDSWTQLVGTHPLVTSRGIMLLPPYLVGLVVGGLATSIALRSRSPGAPLIVPTLVFAGVSVLGREDPPWAVGLGFTLLAVAWICVRGFRLEVRSAASALATRLALAALVLGIAAAAARPVTDALDVDTPTRLLARDVAPAYDVGDVRTPLESFRRYTKQLPHVLGNLFDHELLEVTGLPEGSRLRFLALDAYDWKEWHPDDKTVPGRRDDRFLRVDGTLDNPAAGEEAFVNVSVLSGWDSQWVPTAGAVQWFGFDGDRAADRLQGFRYNPATSTGVMTSQLTPSDNYEFSTVLTDDRLTPDMQPSPQINHDNYLLAVFLDLPALAWSRGATSPIDGVFRAAEVLRTTGRYSDGALSSERKYRAGHGRGRLGQEFVNGSLTGDDEQYAATMALVATRLGVPARVVVGAVVPDDGVIRGRDVQAWVELRVRDGSWRTLPTETFMSTIPPEPDRFDVNPDPALQLPPGTELEEHFDLPPPPKFERKAEARREAERESELTWGWLRWPLGMVGLLLLLAALAVPVAKWLRRRRRHATPRTSLRYAGAWLELVDLARDLGRPVPRGLTRPAEAAAMGRAHDLAELADRVIFGETMPAEAEAEAFWEAIAAERAALRAEAGPLRRVRGVFDPRTLPWRRRRSAGRLGDRFDLRAHRERELLEEGQGRG